MLKVARRRDDLECMASRTLNLRRPDVCAACSAELPAGSKALWNAATRTVTCQACVFVVDAKNCRGKVEVRKPLLGAPKLVIDGRDRSKLIDGLDRQVAAVETALRARGHADVSLRGVLCFTTRGFAAARHAPLVLQATGAPGQASQLGRVYHQPLAGQRPTARDVQSRYLSFMPWMMVKMLPE